MKIITLGDSLLNNQSVLVSDIDQGIRDFKQALFEVMHKEKGIGLAAVQVGQLIRLFITHIPQDIPRVFINPAITETSLTMAEYEEGCLSIPGINADVIRPVAVKVQAWDEEGKAFSLSTDGLLSRTIQHEIDHLDGKLFIDRINPKKRIRLLKHYRGEKLPA